MKTYDDSRIDGLIWQAIAESECPEDFRRYLRHKPEGAAYLEEAIELLIRLDDADGDGPALYPEAIAAILVLAEQGDATAQFHMGKLHGLGWCDGGPPAMEKWYRLAILQNETRSMVNLALAYERGEMIGQNPTAALWLSRAAEQGLPDAELTIGEMFLHGDSVERDVGEASKWFLSAAEEGLPEAQYALGLLYDEGRGLARNPEESERWIRKAAEGGHEDAKQWVEAHGGTCAPSPEQSCWTSDHA